MALVAIAFVIYGTSGPLSQSDATWKHPSDSWRWIPPLRSTDANDVATNILVYVPVGLALRFVARRRGRRAVAEFALTVGGAAGLSWATEYLQQWAPGRTASLTDVSINVVGSMIGALLAPPALRALREIHARAFAAAQVNRSRVLAGVALAAIAIAMTAPWTFGRGAIDLALLRTASVGDLERFAFFAVWGAFLARSVSRPGGLSALASPALLVVGVAAAIEAAQSVLPLHTASLRDLAYQSLGGMFGLTAAAAQRGNSLCRSAAAMAGAALAAAACLSAVSHPSLAIRAPAIDWIPFQAEFNARFVVALAEMLETSLLIGLLALLAFEIADRRAGAAVFLTLASGAAIVEFTRAALTDHVATPTPLVLAALAVWVAGGIWASLVPRGAESAPRAAGGRGGDRSSPLVSTQPI